jgi:WD40 repeat protein
VTLRNLEDPTQSIVYSDFLDKVTCVRYAPNGNYIATGDSKGKVKIWSYQEESKEFLVKKEHQML